MKKEQIVSRNPKVMNGASVFAGTRVPVESLIQHLTAGDSLNEFLDDFPTVSREQVERSEIPIYRGDCLSEDNAGGC